MHGSDLSLNLASALPVLQHPRRKTTGKPSLNFDLGGPGVPLVLNGLYQHINQVCSKKNDKVIRYCGYISILL
jgi:hypothetical protein